MLRLISQLPAVLKMFCRQFVSLPRHLLPDGAMEVKLSPVTP